MTKLGEPKHKAVTRHKDGTVVIKPTPKTKPRPVAMGLRTPKVADGRDLAFPMRMQLGDTSDGRLLNRDHYDNAIWIDQGAESACVGAALTHIIEDSAFTRPESPRGTAIISYLDLYHEAQNFDEWEGTDYDGTSARGGAKVLMDRGLISSFLWAENLTDIIDALLYHGPVAIGTKWTEEMFAPRWEKDALGNPRWTLLDEGPLAGYHEYVLNAVNVEASVVRIKNSWGQWWGDKGRAWMDFDTLERLVFSDGDALIVTEQKAP